jgi:hypothetical protein
VPETRISDNLPTGGAADGDLGLLAEATLAARRLEDVSDVLLLAGYGLGVLVLALGAGPAFVAPGLAIEWRLVSGLGGLLVAAVTFVLLKYVSEGTRALADLARAAARVERKLDALGREREAAAGAGPAEAGPGRKAG